MFNLCSFFLAAIFASHPQDKITTPPPSVSEDEWSQLLSALQDKSKKDLKETDLQFPISLQSDATTDLSSSR